MGPHLAVDSPLRRRYLLPFFRGGAEEVHVDAKRLVPQLHEHVLVVAQLRADPLPLDHRRRVVLDLLDVAQSLAGPSEAGHQLMLVGIAGPQGRAGGSGHRGALGHLEGLTAGGGLLGCRRAALPRRRRRLAGKVRRRQQRRRRRRRPTRSPHNTVQCVRAKPSAKPSLVGLSRIPLPAITMFHAADADCHKCPQCDTPSPH